MQLRLYLEDQYKMSNLGINDIYEMKLNHVRSLEILTCMCKVIEEMKDLDSEKVKFVETAIFQAAERGHVEYITHILRVDPNLHDIKDEKAGTSFKLQSSIVKKKLLILYMGSPMIPKKFL